MMAPAYPGFEVEVGALNADPTPIAQVTVPQIIIGHSAGGAFTNTFSDEESQALYERYHIPDPGGMRSNAEHYTSDTVTERREYPGYAHLPPAQLGWERIADEVLDWTVRQAA
ncbi:hypothetical protein ACIBQ2_06075 [Micromonospora sediminimaris]|uniref:hypothetical protein n=1 Tax=Micromonospora sediminimaris TaxID=547162 RepID=UPI0037A913E4